MIISGERRVLVGMRNRERAKKRLMNKLDELRNVLDGLQEALTEFYESEE